ncbi:MAG: type II toxin-antitoxin system YafQ family toxin [Bacilli bacterium]|nr:type II toxin-antitoxin system YafQ family toxin [Bacilli bacterium]
MYALKFTNQFKKSYKLMNKRGKDITLLDNVIDKIQKGEKLDPKYKDHALTSTYRGFRECHIQPDWLLIYFIENKIMTLTLVNTGTHSDLL